MSVLYPPVLESKAQAIPYLQFATSQDFYTIEFKMPDINSITDIGHIQVNIKYQSTNESAVSTDYSPDGATLYINRAEGAAYFYRKDNGNYVITIPYHCFAGGRPKIGTTYCVQVRFGNNKLWTNGSGLVERDFGGFAYWRNLQVTAMPSQFGEWSNVQTVYCYGAAAVSLTVNYNDFVPELEYSYMPEDGLNDPLEQVKIVYQYADMHGTSFNTLVFNGQHQQDGKYTLRAKIPLAPVQTIFVSLEAVTKNNTVRGKTLNIYPLKYSNALHVLGGTMVDADLQGEENYDGCLAKTFQIDQNNEVQPTDTVSIYRCNVYTLETVKVVEGLRATMDSKITFKDFSVEMGEDYQYVAAVKDKDGYIRGLVVDLYDWGYDNPGYARLMAMESVFLTTRNHQLRLSGNVNVTGFKRVTSDQFQTTLGSKYPFYSRNAETNYRTFQLQGVVTIMFDPTGSFLRNDAENGLWWDDAQGSQLVILNRDLYGETQFSLSRRRMKEIVSGNREYLDVLGAGTLRALDTIGPKSVYDEYLHREITRNVSTDKSDENVYLERKFRDFVMLWLSDGKPKLFRSETEGNMIVMISNASFTPEGKSNRMVYSMSCTVTEIAEYNLENLINYDLVPYNIRTRLISGFPRDLRIGDWIDRQDYLAIVGIDHTAADCFVRSTNATEYQLISDEDKINSIIHSITEYTFIRGDEDPHAWNGFTYQYNKMYNLPDMVFGTRIAPIDTFPAVKGGSGDYTFDNIGTEINKLPTGVRIDPDTGVISGTPTGDTKKESYITTLQVTDNKTKKVAIMEITVGRQYPPLKFEEITFAIPEGLVGSPIEPINVFTEGRAEGDPRIYGGIPFTDVEDGGKTPYIFSAVGLPNGLYIDNNGIIQGGYTEKSVSGFATIQVTDATGQVESQTVQFGAGVYPIYFYHSQDYNIPYTEINVLMEEIDVSAGVSGGHGPYTFTATGLPNGISINRDTGVISGTPTQTGPATTATLTATDTKGAQASITILVQEQLPEFIFEIPAGVAIDPNGTAPTGEPNPMPIGTVIAPFYLRSEYDRDPDGNPYPQIAVRGGLPYVDKPYYRFSSELLVPDFNITNEGKISGRAVVASEGRKATIKVFDARGKMLTDLLDVAEISSNLVYTGPQYSLPDTFVGSNLDTYQVKIPYEYFTGGEVPLDDTYKFTFENLPLGMTAELATEPVSQKRFIWIRPIADGDDFIGEDGKWPAQAKAASQIIIQVEDHGTIPQIIKVKVNVGSIIAPLVWLPQHTFIPAVQKDDVIEPIYLNVVSGGKYPYTVAVIEGSLEPFTIRQTEGAEQDPNRMYITGRGDGIERPAENVILQITDASGQTVQATFTKGASTKALSIDLINSFYNIELVRGVTTVKPTQIAKGVGGAGGPYEFWLIDSSGVEIAPQQFVNGLNFSADGKISGKPTKTINTVNWSGNFAANDGVAGRVGRWNGKNAWWSPPVYEPPRRADGIGETYTEPLLLTGKTYHKAFFKQTLHSKAYFVTEGELPPGLIFSNGYISGSIDGTCGQKTFKMTYIIDAADTNFITQPTSSVSVTVTFEGVSGVLSYVASPLGLKVGPLQVGVAMTPIVVSDGLAGGSEPFEWDLAGAVPPGMSITWTGDGRTATLTGAPTAKSGAYQFEVHVTDATGQTKYITLNGDGVYDKLTFRDSAALDIPAKNSGEDIDPIDINALNLVSGGTGSYTFSADDNLYPYYLDAGVIKGNSGTASYPARVCRITATDTVTKVTAYVDISVGKITGDMSYTGGASIPAGNINTGDSLNLAQYVVGGVSRKYELGALPHEWPTANVTIDQTGKITYTRPGFNQPAGTMTVMVSDTASTSPPLIIEIPVGAVIGAPIKWTGDPLIDFIPAGAVRTTGTFAVAECVDNAVAPQYRITTYPVGWNQNQVTINATTGVISYTRPNQTTGETSLVVTIVDNGVTITGSIPVKSVQ